MTQPGLPLPVDPWAASVESEDAARSAVGPYEVVGSLGQGGMGVVYRARHRELGVTRAVKVMLRADAKGMARFQREVANLARVRHQNVAAIHEAGTDAGRPWFAMELVEGEPLNRLIARGRLPLERALVLSIGIAEGVAALHRAGVIHRDLKPGNVIVRGDGRPMVIDLGLAVAPEQDTRLTKTNAMLGTLNYMAPEQLHRAREVTPRTDVYALGCVVFELVTGAPAIDPELGVHGIVGDVLANDRPLPSSVDPALRGLDELVARATARDPARRFADAGELGDALRRALADPSGPPPRRARPAVVGTVAVAGALAIVGLVGARLLSSREDDAGHAGNCTLPPEVVERGRRELERVRGLSPDERRHALDGWLLQFATHPATEDAVALRRRTLLETPARRWSVPGVKRALFAGDGAHLVTCDASGEVVEWELASGGRRRSWTPVPSVRDAAIAGQRLVLVDDRDRSWELDLATGVTRELGKKGTTEIVALSPDGERLAAGSPWSSRKATPQVTVTDRAGRAGKAFPTGGRVASLAFSADGRTLAIGFGHDKGFELSLDQGVMLVDLERQRVRHRITLLGLPTALVFLDEGKRLAVACDELRIAVFDAGTGQALGDFAGAVQRQESQPTRRTFTRAAHTGPVCSLARGGGRLFSLGTLPDELRVWDAAAERELLVRGGLPKVHRVAASADGRHALIVGEDAVELWDLAGLDGP